MNSLIILTYVYAFIIGICVASFINVVIDRIPRNEDFIFGRSHCDCCKKVLEWYDLIPIVSFIVLKGKCRHCQNLISRKGFIIEILGGLMGMFCFYRFGLNLVAVCIFIILMILLAIGMIDFKTMIIPDELNMALFIVSFVLMCVKHMEIRDSIIGMFCISVPMILLNLLVTESFGGGDIKLMGVIGIALGWKNCLLAAFIGILLAGSYSICLMAQKKVTSKSHIAFGPYLSIGIFIALTYGNEIINWYLNWMV